VGAALVLPAPLPVSGSVAASPSPPAPAWPNAAPPLPLSAAVRPLGAPSAAGELRHQRAGQQRPGGGHHVRQGWRPRLQGRARPHLLAGRFAPLSPSSLPRGRPVQALGEAALMVTEWQHRRRQRHMQAAAQQKRQRAAATNRSGDRRPGFELCLSMCRFAGAVWRVCSVRDTEVEEAGQCRVERARRGARARSCAQTRR
jgi:hypothetical protein